MRAGEYPRPGCHYGQATDQAAPTGEPRQQAERTGRPGGTAPSRNVVSGRSTCGSTRISQLRTEQGPLPTSHDPAAKIFDRMSNVNPEDWPDGCPPRDLYREARFTGDWLPCCPRSLPGPLERHRLQLARKQGRSPGLGPGPPTTLCEVPHRFM